MNRTMADRISLAGVHAAAVVALALAPSSPASEPQATASRARADFLKLCDLACAEVNKETRRVHKRERRVPFYHDSYAVRALAVAYDMTGRKAYLEACKRWSDRMIAFQAKMTPKGAYYMNYGRKPGQNKGGWYVADSSSIAMGILATAVRCRDSADRDRYMSSAESFAKLVMDNYVGESGGITDGLWDKYDGEWWCSSGLFGSLAFLLYEETGKDRYLKVALDALDWLNRLDLPQVKHISFKEAAPAVIMYVLEGYSAGMPHLKTGTPRHRAACVQIGKTLKWMSANQAGRGAARRWDYNSQWGSKLGGLPFHMLVFARHIPEHRNASAAADQELTHIASVLSRDPKPILSQLAVFAMMSYAEKLDPGALYRSTKRTRPMRRAKPTSGSRQR